MKGRDNGIYREIIRLLDDIEINPDRGYALRGEWDGCRATHAGRDRYRVIWEELSPEVDYTGVADEVVPVVVLRVGPKTASDGRAIYDSR